MSWFEEQIEIRKKNDDEGFEEACAELNAAVTGKKKKIFSSDRAGVESALNEILSFYQFDRRDIPENIDDINNQIEYVCHPYGIMRRTVTLKDGWYKDAAGPVLVRKKDGTPAALIPDKLGFYSFYDGSEGKRVRLNKKAQPFWMTKEYVFISRFR